MALIDAALSIEGTLSGVSETLTDANGKDTIKIGHSDAGSGKPLYANFYLTRVGATNDRTLVTITTNASMSSDMAGAAAVPQLGAAQTFAGMPGDGLGCFASMALPAAEPAIFDFGYLQFTVASAGGTTSDYDVRVEIGPRPQQAPRAAIQAPVEV